MQIITSKIDYIFYIILYFKYETKPSGNSRTVGSVLKKALLPLAELPESILSIPGDDGGDDDDDDDDDDGDGGVMMMMMIVIVMLVVVVVVMVMIMISIIMRRLQHTRLGRLK